MTTKYNSKYRYCPDCHNKFILPKATLQFISKNPNIEIKCVRCNCNYTYSISKRVYYKRSWLDETKQNIKK